MPPRTVLIVDSSPLTTRRVEEALAGMGWSVTLASTQTEIDAALERGPVGIVVSSLIFPKGNGYDLCKQVKALNPDALVFLLCGPFEVYSKERARMVGVADRIQRPLVAEAFRRQLEGVLGDIGHPDKSAPGAITGIAENSSEEPGVAEGEGEGTAGAFPRGEEPPRAEDEDAQASRLEPARFDPKSDPKTEYPASTRSDSPRFESAFFDPVATGRTEGDAIPRSRALGISTSDERLATFLPRAYPRPGVETPVSHELAAATERAIALVLPEVLPELIEAVLHNALVSSPALRELVTATVEQVVREQVAAAAAQAVSRRLQELEQAGADPGKSGS